jgi:hypothetical protein
MIVSSYWGKKSFTKKEHCVQMLLLAWTLPLYGGKCHLPLWGHEGLKGGAQSPLNALQHEAESLFTLAL